MRAKLAVAVLSMACLWPFASGQGTHEPAMLFTWSIHSPEVVVAKRALSTYPVGVFTPNKSITVRRLEALSNRGPDRGFLPNGEPVPCPVQYVLELSNGVATENVPISNVFLNWNTSQTYTDSGPLNVVFEDEKRITVSIVPPKAQFPAVSCGLEGLNITIQYEMAAAQKP